MTPRPPGKPMSIRKLLLPALLASLGVGTCVLAGWGVRKVLLARQVDSLEAQTRNRVEFYRLSLESLLAKNESLPRLLTLEAGLREALERPRGAGVLPRADAYLEAVQAGSDLLAAYLMDAGGLTLASSNAGQPGSYVGNNYGFRPYFIDAARDGFGRFYGIGTTTGEPGYFLAARFLAGGRCLGAAVVKVSLDGFETALRRGGDTVLLVDAHGVIFLGSVPEWKYRTLARLDREAQEQLLASRQYGGQDFRPLDTALPGREGAALASLALPGREAADFLVQTVPAGHLGWRVVLLSSTRQARQNALLGGVAAGFAAALLGSLLIYWRLTRQRHRERRQGEAALRRAHQDLERRIAERTGDLVATNLSLEERIGALKAAEGILTRTRDEAVQAGKLAVLGQMAAGISHEITQPLTALNTFADNAVGLMDRGRLAEVRENLGLIRQMSDRVEHIVREVKTFARKAPAERRQLSVHDAIVQAVMMVDRARAQAGAVVEVEPFPEDTRAWADPLRFEQVLLNLLRNALDAAAGAEDRRIGLRVELEGRRVLVKVRDRGPGIAADVQPRLFDPFFTTKPAGQGLGLGLAISRMILSDCGGTLEGRNAEGGGAEFTIALEAA